MKENRMNEVSEKLKRESKAAKACGKYAAAVTDSLVKALEVFAEQDEEFADAILDGSLVECAKVIERGLSGKRAVSDLEVYRMAAGHFFPGAEVEDKPTVNKRINLLDLI